MVGWFNIIINALKIIKISAIQLESPIKVYLHYTTYAISVINSCQISTFVLAKEEQERCKQN